jgi:hypothetical protein
MAPGTFLLALLAFPVLYSPVVTLPTCGARFSSLADIPTILSTDVGVFVIPSMQMQGHCPQLYEIRDSCGSDDEDCLMESDAV